MGKNQKLKLARQATPEPLKLDFGCGKTPREGFQGVDILDFGQAYKVDLSGFTQWPWEDGSVSEAHSSHFIEHLTGPQRRNFVNELYRVLAPGAKCLLITPHWASCRAYGDLTHQWPPVSEFWFYYLSKAWRLGDGAQIPGNAPHDDISFSPQGYSCDFDATWSYSLHPLIAPRNLEYQQNALQFWKESAQDIIATLVKK